MSVWQPLADLIARYGDIDRPVYRCAITDVSLWSATGAAFVRIAVEGWEPLAIFRDQPAPTVGQVVSAVRMSADPQSLWLVLPAPAACPPARFVFSAFDQRMNVGTFPQETDPYGCAVVALGPDGTWDVRAPHPCWGPGRFNYWFGGQPDGANGDLSYAARFPMVRIGAYLYTWAVFSDQPFALYEVPGDPAFDGTATIRQDPFVAGRYFDHTHADNHNLFRATDDGCAWAAVTALAEVRWVAQGAPGLPVYAVTGDGTSVHRSTDDGLTWAQVWDSPGATTDYYSATRIHRLACDPDDGDTVVLAVADGIYLTTDAFATVAGPLGPDFKYEDNFNATANAAGIKYNDSFALGGEGLLRHAGQTLAWRLEASNRSNTSFNHSDDPYPSRHVVGSVTTFPWDGHVLTIADPFPGAGAATAGQFLPANGSIASGTPDGVPAGVNGTDYWRVGTDLYVAVQRDWPALWQSVDDGATWTAVLDKADAVFLPPGAGGVPRNATGGAGVWASGGDLYTGVSGTWFGMHDTSVGLQAGALYQRLYRLSGGAWSDATGTLYADTNATPDGATGRQYTFHDHGMAPGGAV